MHWAKLVKMKNKQKEIARESLKNKTIPDLPLVIEITRIGPRVMDDDNLVSSCKYVRDEIARTIGIDDGSKLCTWIYKQSKGKYGVTVWIVSRESYRA